MKFIKHILTGRFILWTLVFNAMFVTYFYFLIYRPDTFYGIESEIIGTIMVLGIYAMYWWYCIKTFKEGGKA